MKDHSGASPTVDHDQDEIDLLSSPSLARARAVEILASPGIMAGFFRTRLSGLFPEGAWLKECMPKVLRDRLGSRQVVLYRLILESDAGLGTTPMVVILKRYADRGDGERAFRIMKALWENGFDDTCDLKIPKPICYLHDAGLLVEEKTRGMLLRYNLHQVGPPALARMRGVARWLAKLHHLDAGFAAIGPHPDDVASITEFVQQVGSRQPHLVPRLEEFASVMIGRFHRMGDVRLSPVHGDFQCDNIFVEQEKVSVIDFDRFCLSDPARDTGYLIAQMRTMAFFLAATDGSVNPGLKAFWKEYVATDPALEREAFSARTALFAARKCLQNIFYVAYVLKMEDVETINFLLAEAARFADAEQVEEVLEFPVSAGTRRS